MSTGEILAGLLLRSDTWMHRRVESLRMDANGSTRLHVSVDYTLPTPVIPRSRDRVLLPLGLVRKGALRTVDTRGSSGQPLAILDSEENGDLAVDMLLAIAAQALPAAIASSDGCREALESVVFCGAWDARRAVTQFDAWLEQQPGVEPGPARDVFAGMVRQLASLFLFAVEVAADGVGTRSIVKYSYEDEIPTIRKIHIPTTIGRDVPQFGMAASWHFEVEAPPGLGVRRLRVREYQADGAAVGAWEESSSGRDVDTVAHVACRPEHRFTTATAEIVLTPQVRGLPRAAFWGAMATLGLLVLALVARGFPGVFVGAGPGGSSPASILLAGPALLLSWLSRAPEHVMVARLLWPLRWVLVLSSFVLFGMALIVTVPLLSPWKTIAWAVLAAVQLWAAYRAIRLYRSVVRST
ncbi:hypothetical protein [Geodermatophilus sp. SYSU D00710]